MATFFCPQQGTLWRDRAVLKFFFKTVPNYIEHTAVKQEEMNILKINIYISVTATNE